MLEQARQYILSALICILWIEYRYDEMERIETRQTVTLTAY